MHECPECGQACCCSGDIEDHDTGDEYLDFCTCDHAGMDDEDDEERYYPDDQRYPPGGRVL